MENRYEAIFCIVNAGFSEAAMEALGISPPSSQLLISALMIT